MKIFYSAYTCQGNIGDLLITKYQIEEFAKYGEVFVDSHGMPDYFTSVLYDTKNPNIKNFEKEYGMYYRGKNIVKVLRLLNHEGFAIKTGSPGPRVPLKMPLRSIAKQVVGKLIPSFILKKEIKSITLGVDVNYESLLSINDWYFRGYDFIGVRSKSNLERCKKRLSNVGYIPDMAFLYPQYENINVNENRRKIAISFRKVVNYDKLISMLRDIVQKFENKSVEVDIVYQVEEDMVFCKKIYDELNNNNIHFREKLVSFNDLNIYSNYDMVISNRLHVLLMGGMNGAIPYAVVSRNKKENKIVDIFSTVFRHQLTSYIDDFNVSLVLPIYEQKEYIRKILKEDINEQRSKCQEQIKMILMQYLHVSL